MKDKTKSLLHGTDMEGFEGIDHPDFDVKLTWIDLVIVILTFGTFGLFVWGAITLDWGQDMMAAMPENGLHFNPGFAPSHDRFAKQGCKYAERCRERRAQCSQVPPLIDVNGHQVRCWKYA